MIEQEALRAAKAVAHANGHRMGLWSRTYGGCECVRCNAWLVRSDAVGFVERCDFGFLGSFSTPCPYGDVA